MNSRQCDCDNPVFTYHDHLSDHFRRAFQNGPQYYQWLWTPKNPISGRKQHVNENNMLYPGPVVEQKFTEKGELRRAILLILEDTVDAAISKYRQRQRHFTSE